MWTLTPAPEFAFCSDDETVGSTGSRHHTANLNITETSIAMGAPQILPKVPVSSCKNRHRHAWKVYQRWRFYKWLQPTHFLFLIINVKLIFCTWPICHVSVWDTGISKFSLLQRLKYDCYQLLELKILFISHRSVNSLLYIQSACS